MKKFTIKQKSKKPWRLGGSLNIFYHQYSLWIYKYRTKKMGFTSSVFDNQLLTTSGDLQ